MYAFRLSGEKAAAVAPLMGRTVEVLALPQGLPLQLKTKVSTGVSLVSDRMALVPSGETASTLPGADGNEVTDEVAEDAFSTINPLVPSSPRSVPRSAEVPLGSITREFGVAGRLIGVPTVFAGTAIGVMVLIQPFIVPHPVLETQIVSEAAAFPAVTRKSMAEVG